MATPLSPRTTKAARAGLIVVAGGLGWWMLQPSPSGSVASPTSSASPTPVPEASVPQTRAGAPMPPAARPNEVKVQPSAPAAVAGASEQEEADDVPSPEQAFSALVQARGPALLRCLPAAPPYHAQAFYADVHMSPTTQGDRIVYDADFTIELVDDTLPAPEPELMEATLDCLEAETADWSLPATGEAREMRMTFGGSQSAPEEEMP